MSEESKTLTKIIGEHQSLAELMLERGGEITEAETEAIVNSWIAEIFSDLGKKIDGYAYRFKALESAEESLDKDLKALRSALRAVSSFKDNLKDRLKYGLIELGVTRVVGEKHIVALSNGKPSVEIFDESALPATFCREKVVIEPDKALILEALQSGKEVPGARLKESMTIRMTMNNKMKELGVERLVKNEQ